MLSKLILKIFFLKKCFLSWSLKHSSITSTHYMKSGVVVSMIYLTLHIIFILEQKYTKTHTQIEREYETLYHYIINYTA